MTFAARLNYPELRFRCYVHSAGFEAIYGKNIPADNPLWTPASAFNAGDYAKEVLGSLDGRVHGAFDYFLAVAWGNEESGQKVLDLFGFSGIRDWQTSNPDVTAWIFADGIYVSPQPPNALTCGDALIMLGEEEKYRRTTPDLETYLLGSPHLGPLEPTTQMQSPNPFR